MEVAKPSIRLRRGHPDDARALVDIYRPYVQAEGYCFEVECPPPDEFARRMADALSRWDWWIAESEGRALGYAYAGPHRSRAAYRFSCEVSVYVDQAAQGRGIGAALYAQLLPSLAGLGYFNALAVVVLPNSGSVAFHERQGFQTIGRFSAAGYKQGRWWDVGWLQKRLREGDPSHEPGILPHGPD